MPPVTPGESRTPKDYKAELFRSGRRRSSAASATSRDSDQYGSAAMERGLMKMQEVDRLASDLMPGSDEQQVGAHICAEIPP